MYSVGDHIVYPMHGAGTIIDIETKTMFGEEQEFYKLKMPIGSVVIMVPVENAESIGIRPVIKPEEGKKVIEVLKEDTTEMPENWNKRYRENLDYIRTGDIYEIAHVVKNLQILDEKKGLSTSEKKMLDTSKKIIVSELILIGLMNKEEAESMIDEAITLEEGEE